MTLKQAKPDLKPDLTTRTSPNLNRETLFGDFQPIRFPDSYKTNHLGKSKVYDFSAECSQRIQKSRRDRQKRTAKLGLHSRKFTTVEVKL